MEEMEDARLTQEEWGQLPNPRQSFFLALHANSGSKMGKGDCSFSQLFLPFSFPSDYPPMHHKIVQIMFHTSGVVCFV